MSEINHKSKILAIQENISNIKEYINSDMCLSCKEAAYKLEQYVQELIQLLNQEQQ